MKFLIFIVICFFFLFIPFFGNSQSKGLTYKWRKISGPDKYKIVSPDSAVTNVTDLVEGVYKFELTVTNNLGLSSRDTMTLTVSPPNKNQRTTKQVVNRTGKN
jgi:hypothetical protein